MFTGLCEEIGTILNITRTAAGYVLDVKCALVLDGMKNGDSISIDGACHTVTFFDSQSFKVESSTETIEHTSLAAIKNGSRVNLERALTLQTRLGGHFVTGHIDCTATVSRVLEQGFAKLIYFNLPMDYADKLVDKGSVAVNGASLTVCKPQSTEFYVSIIPHSFENTTLSALKQGGIVNIETDILGKYVAQLLKNKDGGSKIDIGLLERSGFLDG